MSKLNKKMPPAQAIAYVIEGARTSLELLKELQTEWEQRRAKQLDGAILRRRQRIVADALTMYVASLFDKRRDTHSLVTAYQPHKFITDFRNQEVVKKCIEHRHNRSGHQSQKYGFVIPLEVILSSNLDAWLSEALYGVISGHLVLRQN